MVTLDDPAIADLPPATPGEERHGLRKLLIVGVSVLALTLSACEGREKTTIGAAGGGAAGGLIAAAAGGGAAGIAGGVLLGMLAGGLAGNYLDNKDREHAYRAQQDALEAQKSGQTTTWVNPDSGHSGSYTPQRTYEDPATGQYCREFQQTITVDGKTENAFGVACRQPDGSWKIKDST